MMGSRFTKAVRTQRKLRATFFGPSGSGKTWTALEVATAIGKRVLVIDTEYGSASLYADHFDFDTVSVTNHDLRGYVDLLRDAAKEGYDAIVLDSLTHAWQGFGGELEMADAASAKYRGNSHAAWRDVRPHERKMLDAMLGYPGHVITTMRSKTAYEVEKDERTGKSTPKKIGLAPIQKEGLEYEFDLIGEIGIDHVLIVTKTRFKPLDGLVVEKPGRDFAAMILAELSRGVEAPAPVEEVEAEYPQSPPTELRVRPFVEFIESAAKYAGVAVHVLVDDLMRSLIEEGKVADGMRDLSEKTHILSDGYKQDYAHVSSLITHTAKALRTTPQAA